MLPRTYVTIQGVKFFVADLKQNFCCLCIREQLSSYHGLIENVYDSSEEILFKVSKLHSGIEYVKLDIISLNSNDDNSKRTIVKNNHYTDNYIERDSNKCVTGKTLNRISEEIAKQLIKCGKKRSYRSPREIF